MQNLRNLFDKKQHNVQRTDASHKSHSAQPASTYLATDKELEYFKQSLIETRNLAKQMEKCFSDVTTVVMKQDQIIRNGEESLTEAAKDMKKSRIIAKKAITRKVKAMKRDCYFTMVISLAILWGFGICFGYLWSLNDTKS